MSNILCGTCVSEVEQEIEDMSEEEILAGFVEGKPLDDCVKDRFIINITRLTQKNDPVISQFIGGHMFFFCPTHYVEHQMGE